MRRYSPSLASECSIILVLALHPVQTTVKNLTIFDAIHPF